MIAKFRRRRAHLAHVKPPVRNHDKWPTHRALSLCLAASGTVTSTDRGTSMDISTELPAALASVHEWHRRRRTPPPTCPLEVPLCCSLNCPFCSWSSFIATTPTRGLQFEPVEFFEGRSRKPTGQGIGLCSGLSLRGIATTVFGFTARIWLSRRCPSGDSCI